MKKALFAVVLAGLLTGISLAQSSTSPSSGSAAQQQSSNEMQTNPTPSQNPQATGEASASGQIAPGTVIPAELAKSIDAKKAKQGDQVVAKTSQDLLSGGQVIIPRGAKIIGHVTQAKAREKGEPESTLGIAFDKLVMKDGHELPLNASIQALAGPPSMAASSAAPMSESGGMPGGMSGSASGGMGGGGARGAGSAGTSPTAPGSPGSYPQDTGVPSSAGTSNRTLAPNAQGVVGISGLSLTTGADNSSVITSQNKNVKLDGGTQLMLRVNGK
jgi:hypothetical protein